MAGASETGAACAADTNVADSGAANCRRKGDTSEAKLGNDGLMGQAPLHSPKVKRGPPLLVLKVGTSSLMVSNASGQQVRLANVSQLIELIASLKRDNFDVVLISSGAVGMGCIKLGIPKPTKLRTKQAVAAAGQSKLMRMYEDLFSTLNVQVAQLLVSQNDFMDQVRWQNIKHTIGECLQLGLVPIINENDSTNTEELRFGDNDNLAALTAVQLQADGLFLFTDVDFLYTANPRTDPDAKPLRIVDEPWALRVDTRDAGSGLGTGGMSTKIFAARTVSCAGIPCGLINGAHPMRLLSFLHLIRSNASIPPTGEPAGDGVPDGTYFKAMEVTKRVTDTRRWILSLPISGDIIINDGAARALANHKSLLPAGIENLKGNFLPNESVRVMHGDIDVGRALVNMGSEDLRKIMGKQSSEFEDILGYVSAPEACHRSNIILTASVQVEG